MKNSNVLLMGLAVAGLVVGAYGYDRPVDCRVDALLGGIQWGQTTAKDEDGSPRCYNYYVTNHVDAANDHVGCFPVAVGQVMKYWGDRGYDCTNGPVTVDCVVSGGTTAVTNGLTTFGGPYDWDSMPEKTHEDEPTPKQCEAIGRLMYDIAVASASTFSTNLTTASPLSVLRCMRERVGGFANAEIAIFNGKNCPYTVDRLKQLVLPNLEAKAPVILAVAPDRATEAQEGIVITHALVVDGYGYDGDRLMLHANLGAWGNGDGWFDAEEGFTIGSETYSDMSVCLYNLFPTNCGSVVSGRVLDASGRRIEGATVQVFSNETPVATCETDQNGIYAFVLAPGEYVVKTKRQVKNEVFTAEIPLVVGETASRQVSAEAGDDRYLDDRDHAPLIGNSFGNDLRLTGLYTESAEPPTVVPANRVISGLTQVTLACETPGAVIRYTLDGSDPTLQSPIYTNGFWISDRVTVKAIAFARNMNPSEMVTAEFTYKNAKTPVGDDRDAPMMLTGTNVTRTVNDYCTYARKEGDPFVDQDLWEYFQDFSEEDQEEWLTEDHDAWFRWTAVGDGTVRLFGDVTGPSEWEYPYAYVEYPDGTVEYAITSLTPELRYPHYGVRLAVYLENEDGSLGERQDALQTDFDPDQGVELKETAGGSFVARQGQSYLIQVVCPYDLRNEVDYWWYGPWYMGYSEDEGFVLVPFPVEKAYLELKLEADLTIVPPPAAKLTVPAMAHCASVTVTTNGVEIPVTAGGSIELAPDVNYTVVYTAASGYAFADGKTTWSAIVRDDTGTDFSVAELDGFPSEGPQRVTIRYAKLDVPNVPHATVEVLTNDVLVCTSPGKLELHPGVRYAVVYTAASGYAFADGKKTWSASGACDGSGLDIAVADFDGFPKSGPSEVSVKWSQPETDGEAVSTALKADGFSGAVLEAVTTVEEHRAFVGYLSEKADSAQALTSGQKQNAYLCYRLGADEIPAEPLKTEDVTIAASTVQTDGSLALELKIEGVKPGETVSPAVIQELVSAEGGDDPSNLDAANVTLSGEGVADGKVRVNVKPNAAVEGGRPAKFFTRLRLMQ